MLKSTINALKSYKQNFLNGSTYRTVGVGQLLQVVVVSIKREGFFPVEGQNFGEGCCVVLWENLTITVGNQWQMLEK